MCSKEGQPCDDQGMGEEALDAPHSSFLLQKKVVGRFAEARDGLLYLSANLVLGSMRSEFALERQPFVPRLILTSLV